MEACWREDLQEWEQGKAGGGVQRASQVEAQGATERRAGAIWFFPTECFFPVHLLLLSFPSFLPSNIVSISVYATILISVGFTGHSPSRAIPLITLNTPLGSLSPFPNPSSYLPCAFIAWNSKTGSASLQSLQTAATRRKVGEYPILFFITQRQTFLPNTSCPKCSTEKVNIGQPIFFPQAQNIIAHPRGQRNASLLYWTYGKI